MIYALFDQATTPILLQKMHSLSAIQIISSLLTYNIRLQSNSECKKEFETNLEHEVGNDTVELGSLEVKGFALLAHALLAGAQAAEVLSGLRYDVIEQLNIIRHYDNSATRITRIDVCILIEFVEKICDASCIHHKLCICSEEYLLKHFIDYISLSN